MFLHIFNCKTICVSVLFILPSICSYFRSLHSSIPCEPYLEEWFPGTQEHRIFTLFPKKKKTLPCLAIRLNSFIFPGSIFIFVFYFSFSWWKCVLLKMKLIQEVILQIALCLQNLACKNYVLKSL